MPSFSDSFWSTGYASGFNIVFDKLHQGCVENDEVLAMAAARADAEEAYGNRLLDIPVSFVAKKNGFARDDGASLRKAYEGIIDEMGHEGKHHIQVADSIRRMVLVPFGKWADEHRQRVDYSSNVLKNKLKSYDKELNEVQKAQKRYFNKCRVLEDFKGSEEANTNNVETATAASSNVTKNFDGKSGQVPADDDSQQKAVSADNSTGTSTDTPVNKSSAKESTVNGNGDQQQKEVHPDLDDDPVQLGDDIFPPEQARVLFRRMLDEIPQKSVKVAILGTYDNVSSGDAIVSWIQANIAKDLATSLASAERFGQDLINEGFLRLVGQVGSKFANSSVMHYQWRKRTFLTAGRRESRSEGGYYQGQGNGHQNSNSVSTSRDLIAPIVGEYLSETIHNYINNPHQDETPEERLVREVNELDQRYKQSVLKLDDTRCNLEESAIDHLKFMERCEFDRLRAIKAVFLDFLAALSNVIPSIQSTVDKLLLYQETVQPASDLRYILESYRTGSFSPKVTIYDNYYNPAEDQAFGVDLELRCRGDRKRVPFIVSTILGFLDSQYPDLDNDQVRLSAWIVSVPLKSTHKLRREINVGGQFSRDTLSKYETPIVASVLKLYLVELPDSVIPSSLYDVVKTIYSQHSNDEDPRHRISAIQNTFSQLRVSNIATLDAVTTHLTRLASITNASQEYIAQLAQEFSHCLLRPRSQSALTLGDRHAYLLVKDLLLYKREIFSELKRNNSSSSSRKVSSELSLSSSSSIKQHSSVNSTHRLSLQNRMNALSLKIRKSANENEEQAIESEDQATAEVSVGSVEDHRLTSSEPTSGEAPATGEKVLSAGAIDGNEDEHEGSMLYDDDHDPEAEEAPAQTGAGRQNQSLTTSTATAGSDSSKTTTNEGGSADPIVID